MISTIRPAGRRRVELGLVLGVLLALSMLLLAIGCGRTPAPDGSKGKASAAPAEHRFVVFSPAIGVMLRDLGFEDSVVGKHSYDTALSDSIPVVGSHLDIDYELLITLAPTDLFFERNSVAIPDRIRALAGEHGWRLWSYKLETLDDIAATVDDLYLKLVAFADGDRRGDPGLLGAIRDPGSLDPSRRFNVPLPSERLARAWSPIGAPATHAGRLLLLASVDPPGALGPGSFHAQLIERLGVSPAIDDGGMWRELDYEDIINLAPDSIIVLLPKAPGKDELIGEPEPLTREQINEKVGAIASLPIPAARAERIAVIEDPLCLLPSTTLGRVGEEIARILREWDQ